MTTSDIKVNQAGSPRKHRKKDNVAKAEQSKLLTFVNSNFGLFLLSTVFISSFSWGFNAFLTHQHDVKESQKNRQKIGLEIMNRIRYIDELKAPFPYNEYHTIQSAIDGFTVSANVNPSWIPHYSAVFPEYEPRSFMSLLWELETLSLEPQKKKLQSAHKPIETLNKYFQKLQYRVVNAPNRNPEGKIEILELSPDDVAELDNTVLKQINFLRDPTYYEPQ
jgi:hypothetical protein